MNKKLIVLFSILSCVVSGYNTSCFAQVNMIVLEPPSKFSINDLWNISIMIPTHSNFNSFFLTVDIYEQNNGQIVHCKSSNFYPNLGSILINKSTLSQIQPIKYTYFVYGDLKLKIENGEQFPSGKYSIFVKLYGYQLLPELIQKNVIVSEYNYIIEDNIIQPPFLIYIYDNDCTNEKNPTFIWTSPFPVLSNSKIEYSFKLVEVNPNQSNQTAIGTNRAQFSENHISNTFLTYPIHAPQFINNHQYAWQIEVYLDNKYSCSTEIWGFTYNENCNNNNEESSKTNLLKLPFLELKSEIDGNFYNASNNIIKFIYTETYYKDSNSILIYRLINEDNKVIATNENSIQLKVKQGSNKYEINVCDFKNNLPQGFYILEIKNDKNQMRYLKFYKPNNNCN